MPTVRWRRDRPAQRCRGPRGPARGRHTAAGALPRGDHCEVALVRGPVGWAEFAPSSSMPTTSRAAGWPLRWRPRGTAGRLRSGRTSRSTRRCPRSRRLRSQRCWTASRVHDGPGQGRPARPAAERRPRPGGRVREHLGPTGRIRVDANGAWSLDDAVTAHRLGGLSARVRRAALRRGGRPGPAAGTARRARGGGCRRRGRVDPASRDPCAWRGRRPPTSSSSRSPRSAGCAGRCRSSPSVGCPPWCRPP